MAERFDLVVLRSGVGAGESWAAAADRLRSPSAPDGPMLAVDLSGEELLFALDPELRIACRPMTEGDLPDLVRWINAPHVARWWDDHRSLEQVRAHYGPGLRGEDPVRYWIWELNGRSVGFGQDYRVSDHDDYALLCGRPDAVGVDYLVGEEAFIGRGLGTSLLWVYLRDVVAPAYDAKELFAAPDHRNVASRRVLAKLGALEGMWFDEPRADGGVDTVVGCSIDVARVMSPTVTQQ